MQLQLRRATNDDLATIVDLGLLAWAPVFASLRQTFSPGVYGLLYPDWERQQREVIERICAGERTTVWVAELDGEMAGFVAYTLDQGERIGTVELLAVHPGYQQRGVATALNRVALDAIHRVRGWAASRRTAAGARGSRSKPVHGPQRRRRAR